jgi:hypothetical protein
MTEKAPSAAPDAYLLGRPLGVLGNDRIDVALVGSALVVHRWVRDANCKHARKHN